MIEVIEAYGRFYPTLSDLNEWYDVKSISVKQGVDIPTMADYLPTTVAIYLAEHKANPIRRYLATSALFFCGKVYTGKMLEIHEMPTLWPPNAKSYRNRIIMGVDKISDYSEYDELQTTMNVDIEILEEEKI